MTNKKRRAIIARVFRANGFNFADSHRAARLWFNFDFYGIADRYPKLVQFVDAYGGCDCCSHFVLRFTQSQTIISDALK